MIASARLFLLSIACLFLPGASAGSAQPSFDCAKAALPAEKLICGSVELSGLDEMLARSYTVAVGELGIAGVCMRIDQSRRAARGAQSLPR